MGGENHVMIIEDKERTCLKIRPVEPSARLAS